MNQKDQSIAISQFEKIQSLAGSMRLAAEGWDLPYKTLVATMLSAQTMDETTIPVSTKLFEIYPTIKDLANADLAEVSDLIKRVNYYKTKAKHIIATSRIITDKYDEKIPMDFTTLLSFPGVGNKTANVFLSEYGIPAIAVDTHVHYIANFLGWSDKKDPKKVQIDLERIFPRKLWSTLNPVLVRFGKKYTSRIEKDKILERIKNIS